MRRFSFLFIGLLFSTVLFAQKVVERAIVKSVTEITFPQNNNNAPGGDDDAPRPFGGGMESTNTVYYRGDFIKTFNQTDFGNNTVIIDKKNNKTITIMEAMGRKTGYYSTPEDEELMRKRMDSLRQAGGGANRQIQRREGEPEIVETEETRKIAGYNCKKTIIRTKANNGEVNETIVWYTPDLKMPAEYPQAGMSAPGGGRGFAASFGGGSRGGGIGIPALNKINGFVMGYEMSRPNGFSMKMEVKKIEVDPEIKDKVFEVPKGTELKPISEMQNMFGPGGPGFRGRQVIVVDGN
ncbi:MAG: hypothetical protein KIT80_17665 [Chitinophagaceae bacterium]|nr:hypothetical protein [Chitinophagaceae bacterium]MCW5928752.1 hypothetical protein [Chitinophagaceae bacterium]